MSDFFNIAIEPGKSYMINHVVYFGLKKKNCGCLIFRFPLMDLDQLNVCEKHFGRVTL